jgi:hypothetical protein
MLKSKISTTIQSILTLILVLSLNITANAKYSGGTGEPNNPYQIATADDLITLGETAEDYNMCFILTADIDLDPNLPGRKVFDKAVIAPDADNAKEQFQGTSFTGLFDGNGHYISNLTIKGRSYLGLFGQLGISKISRHKQIYNLGVVDVNIIGSGSYIGGLVGSNGPVNGPSGVVTSCYSIGSVSGIAHIGGLVGDNNQFGLIINCYSKGKFRGNFFVGGLVGYNYSDITSCFSTGIVSSEYMTGGLVGENYYGTITQCYSYGPVDGNNYVGGLIGSNNGNITLCYSNGTVSGKENVGGLVGENYSFHMYYHDTRTVKQCYSTGTVSGENNVGGLVGINRFDGDINDSFWDIQSSGYDKSDGGTGKVTTVMKTKSTFTDVGWDFVGETVNGTDDIWSICEGTNYPRFVWQIPKGDFVCPDGITIEEDFDFFFNHWGNTNCDQSNGYCDGTDLDLSGIVDIYDFEIIINNWLKENL